MSIRQAARPARSPDTMLARYAQHLRNAERIVRLLSPKPWDIVELADYRREVARKLAERNARLVF